ncbi:MAG: glycosyltransferase family 2 protein [Pseudonocardiaceae bacterium]
MSVIVATRNRSDMCRRLCVAVDRQFEKHPHVQTEIVLVFDGCPAYDWVSTQPHYRTVPIDSQVGIARGRNAGIEVAKGDVLAFLDDDCVPAAGWLSDLFRALNVYPQMVAFGGRVVGIDQINLYSQLRKSVYYYETFGPWYVNDAAEGDLPDPPYVNGGNCAYRREAIIGSGGFDSILPAYSDVELGRRLLRNNGILVAGMAIHHDHPGTFREYMLRCFRSGRARGILWAQRGYPQDAPATVTRAILANILWNNAARRIPRINAARPKTLGVLFLQEVIHGIGYAHSLVHASHKRRDRSRGRVADTPRGRADRDPL